MKKKKKGLAAKLVALSLFGSSCIALQYVTQLTTLEIGQMVKALSNSTMTRAYYAGGGTSPDRAPADSDNKAS